ncbi:MAG: metallophosphoesterase [Parcubacteria group bacterium]|jgi:hypothetical protein
MNIWGVIIMLFIFIAILFGGHFFIYFSLVKFLSIESANIKIGLALGLFALGISYVVSSILAHYGENIFTRVIYFISGLWLAVGWNILMAFMLLWITVGFFKFFSFNFNYKYLAIFSIILALVYSSYGVWCAFNPKIKNITVKIKNLPQEWENKKVVQLSDIHLGHIYGKNFLSKIVSKTNIQNPDVVFITGDLFDGMDGSLDALVGPLSDLGASGGVYFVTGNHETYLGVDKTVAILEKTPVRVLNNEMINVSGMQILGVSYPQRGEEENIKKIIKEIRDFNPQQPSILLYHSPSVAREAKKIGIDLQLAGHTHKGQLFPFQFITQLIYGKYHYGFSKENDFSIYTSVGVGTWGPAMRTSGRPEIVVISFK